MEQIPMGLDDRTRRDFRIAASARHHCSNSARSVIQSEAIQSALVDKQLEIPFGRTLSLVFRSNSLSLLL
jgi:hypothetical protein